MQERKESKNPVVSLEPASDAELIDVDAGRMWGWECGGWTTVNQLMAESPLGVRPAELGDQIQ